MDEAEVKARLVAASEALKEVSSTMGRISGDLGAMVDTQMALAQVADTIKVGFELKATVPAAGPVQAPGPEA